MPDVLEISEKIALDSLLQDYFNRYKRGLTVKEKSYRILEFMHHLVNTFPAHIPYRNRIEITCCFFFGNEAYHVIEGLRGVAKKIDARLGYEE